MIVTIDGPVGSGKSTVANKLANRLGFVHLNSGALFRAVAYKALLADIGIAEEERIAGIARSTDFQFEVIPSADVSGVEAGLTRTLLLVDGVDLSEQISANQVSNLSSKVAVLPKLRDVLLEVQRKVGEKSSLVLEGRDSGTVVFPWAQVKFYLEAKPEIRAKRRFLELLAREGKADDSVEGQPSTRSGITEKQVLEELTIRDQRELTRAVAPLVKAVDALLIDSTDFSAEEVVDQMLAVVKQRKRELTSE